MYVDVYQSVIISLPFNISLKLNDRSAPKLLGEDPRWPAKASRDLHLNSTWLRDPTFWASREKCGIAGYFSFLSKNQFQGNHLATQLASSCRHPHFCTSILPHQTGHVQTPPAFSPKICQLHPQPVGTATGRSKSSGSGLWRSKRHDLPNFQRCATPTSGCCRDVLPEGRIG